MTGSFLSGFSVTTVERPGGVRVFTVVGDVDTATSRRLASALAGAGRVVVDLSRVEFLGLCGVDVLIGAHESAERLVVVASGHSVLRSLRVTGADAFLRLRPALPAALTEVSIVDNGV